MIDNQIIETIQSLNKQYGRELTLDELLEIESKTHIFNRIAINNNFRKGINQFMLVHVTNYAPTNNQIKTPLQTGQSQKKETPIGETELKSFRDTVHFTVNTTVSSHGGGNWSERKYAIFLPMDSFVEKNGQKIKSCQVVDFFIDGPANLPNNAYLLCPQDELEEIKKANPNINVIGYQGKNVIEYTEKFLKMLEISTKKCGAWGYIDDDEKDFHTQKELQELLSQKLGKKISTEYHTNTIEHAKESTLASLYPILTAVNNIKRNNLLNKISKEKIIPELADSIDPTLGWNWKISENSKEELQELANQINQLSIPLGISILQEYIKNGKREKNKESINERIYESLKIDDFIDKDITEIYEEDMLFTNIKRINLILDKIESNNLYKDASAINILSSAIKHLQVDYKITLEKLDIRKKYDDKFDLKKYQSKLDERLMSLGINHKYLEKENLQNIMIKERQNKQFIEKNFPTAKEDYILNMLNALSNLEKLICNRFQLIEKNNLDYDEVYSKAFEIYEYLTKKIEMDLDEDYLIEIKKNNSNIEEYLKILEQVLNRFGVSINDFINSENKENYISKKMNQNLEKKLDIIEMQSRNPGIDNHKR